MCERCRGDFSTTNKMLMAAPFKMTMSSLKQRGTAYPSPDGAIV